MLILLILIYFQTLFLSVVSLLKGSDSIYDGRGLVSSMWFILYIVMVIGNIVSGTLLLMHIDGKIQL